MKQIRRQAIDVQAAHHVAHVERPDADLHRGGRRCSRRDAVAADLIVDRERHTPRRDQGRGAAGQAGAQGGR